MNRQYPNKPKLDWLHCPMCEKKRWVFRAREQNYQCRHCGMVFRADWKAQKTLLVNVAKHIQKVVNGLNRKGVKRRGKMKGIRASFLPDVPYEP